MIQPAFVFYSPCSAHEYKLSENHMQVDHFIHNTRCDTYSLMLQGEVFYISFMPNFPAVPQYFNFFKNPVKIS